MQDLNNDMDDLFRQAAENYPLRTDGKDWDKVLQNLQRNDIPLPASIEDNKKRKYRALWLLLLLPLALLYIVSYNHSEISKKAAVTEKQIQQNKQTDKPKEDNLKTPGANNQQANNLSESKKGNELNKIDNTSQNPGIVQDRSSNQTIVAGINTKKDNKKNASSYLPGSGNKKNDETEDKSRYKVLNKSNDKASLTQDKNNDEVTLTANKKSEIVKQPDITSSRIQNIQATSDSLSVALQKEQVDSNKTIVQKEDSAATKNTTEAAKTTKKVKAKIQPQKGFYAGLMASFDISTIKLQKVNNTGYSLNVLLGYRFAKHVSVESGIDWTSKKYYSTGQYFDKSRTGISEQSKIIYTNGVCNMYEIPVNIKYDFAFRSKSNLFATAGLSSYIMRDEKYDYYADHEGNYYSATKKYKNSGSNWFSVAGFSIGYQLNLNKHTTLRVEPYIKMPLTGIGIAKLPITSTGISAGFTRSF